MRIRLNTVLTLDTFTCIESVFLLAARINAESITFIPLRPQVRDVKIRNRMLNASQFREAIEIMIELRHRYGVDFTTTIETDFKDEILSDKIFKKQSSCAAGCEGTNLDYDISNNEFLMYGCSYCPASDPDVSSTIRAPFLAGKIPFDRPELIDDVWNNENQWQIYRNLSFKSEDCGQCAYYRSRCTGSCPIQNINFEELRLDTDVLSQLKEQMRRNGEWYCYKKLK